MLVTQIDGEVVRYSAIQFVRVTKGFCNQFPWRIRRLPRYWRIRCIYLRCCPLPTTPNVADKADQNHRVVSLIKDALQLDAPSWFQWIIEKQALRNFAVPTLFKIASRSSWVIFFRISWAILNDFKIVYDIANALMISLKITFFWRNTERYS